MKKPLGSQDLQVESFEVDQQPRSPPCRGGPSPCVFFARGMVEDSATADVELPCTAKEFTLLLGRLYYPKKRLGCPDLPVESFSVAARLALAVDFLGGAELFPELFALVKTLPRSPEEVKALHSVAGALPAALSESVSSIDGEVPPETLRGMLVGMVKCSREARDGVRAVLARCCSCKQKEAIEAEVRSMLKCKSEEQTEWAGEIASEWLDCAIVNAIFTDLSAEEERGHSNCGKADSNQWPCSLRRWFCSHLQRCVAEGADWSAIVALGNGKTANFSHDFCRGSNRCDCQAYRVSALAFDESCQETLVALAQSSSAVLSCWLMRFPAEQLAKLMTPELMQALGWHAGRVCQAMADKGYPNQVCRSLTPDVLRALGVHAGPISQSMASKCPGELVKILTPQLLQAMGSSAGPVCDVTASKCPGEFVKILSPELLQAIGSSAGPVCVLTASRCPVELLKILTPELLQAMGSSAGPVCEFTASKCANELKKLLTPQLLRDIGPDADGIAKAMARRPELHSIVTSELLLAMGAHARPVCVALLPKLGNLQQDLATLLVKGLSPEGVEGCKSAGLA